MVLLDTHVWVWSAQGDSRRIGRQTRRLLSRAESQDAVRVSPITVFELTALVTLGRIRLTRRPDEWIRHSLESGGIRLAEFSSAIAIDAGQIARDFLADPLDRILIATARHIDATFLTSDARILDYASKSGDVRAHDAGV